MGVCRNDTPRRMHLGVDYGTAWSKLVLRDMEPRLGEPQAFVVLPADPASEYRFPSLVTWHSNRLYFGWRAEETRLQVGARVYPSLKMRMIDAVVHGYQLTREELPPGLSEEDLVVLLVLYLLQEGLEAASAYAQERASVPKLSMTIGIPMTPKCFPHVQTDFARVAAKAYSVLAEGRFSSLRCDGLSLDEARALAAEWGARPLGRLNPAFWVRSEAGAAMHWAFESPSVPEGLYTAVDIGAGTMSTSVFRLHAHRDREAGVWVKDSVIVFGASCGPPGMDGIDQILGDVLGTSDISALRGKEAEHWGAVGRHPGLKETFAKMDGNRKAAFQQAYGKDRSQRAWLAEAFEGAFLFGGGHRVGALRQNSLRSHLRGCEGVLKELDLDWPRDLRFGLPQAGRTPAGSGVAARDLMVGYGLSFPYAAVFPVESPDSIEPLDRSAFYRNVSFVDRDELYAR